MQNSYIIINPKDSSHLLICKQFNNCTGFVSSIKKNNNNFQTGLETTLTQLNRFDAIYNLNPLLCSYKKIEDKLFFDCITPIHKKTDVLAYYPQLTDGYIHFDASISYIEDSDNIKLPICYINPRLLVQSITPIKLPDIQLNHPSKFKTNGMKIFGCILIKGFIEVRVFPKYREIRFTLTKPCNNLVGITGSSYKNTIDLINMIFPIFEYKLVSNKLFIYLANDYLAQKTKIPLLLNITMQTTDYIMHPSIIGKSLFIR